VRRGFTLVELSIVLVILGLLVGGVLAGQSLIRSAELRKATETIASYQVAIHAFRDKYFALPGDITNAASFWPDCTDGNGSLCNGNGDGSIDYWTGSVTNEEPARVFEHLSRAGLIKGQYDGNHDPMVAGNLPLMFAKSSILGLARIQMLEPGWWFDNKQVNFLRHTQAGAYGASLTSEEYYRLDTKMDDGNGFNGNYRIMYDELPSQGCIDVSTGAYLPTNPADHCNLYVNIGV
jgi:prepilin-type N-terminal cleavage/methylation domain-containing protein